MDFQTLNLLFRCSKEFNHEKIRLRELTETECMICSFLCRSTPCSQEEVVRALRADKTTIGKALQKLEARGYVSREEDPGDRRKKLLRLTELGLAQTGDIMGIHDRWLKTVLSALSEEEQRQFEDYCRRLLASAEELLRKTEETDN